MRLVFLTLFLLVAGSLATRNDDLAFRVNEYLRNSYNFPAYQAPADDKTNILNFVKGFLNGVGTSSIFDNVKACIQDDQIIITDMINGVEMIQTKVASKVEEGIALIGKAVEIIPTAVEQCKVAGADLATLLKMVKSFKNPASFLYYVGKSIVINRVDVFKEVNSAVKAYQTGDFTNFGYWIGRAMDTIFIGQKALNAKDTKTDVVNFVKGFLSGVGSASVFDNIKTCIADVDTFGTDIYTAIEDIKSKDAAKVKQGIILLGQAAQLVPAAAQACQASAADIQKFIKFAKSFSNPEAFLYYIGKSLLINHVEVIHEVTSAVQAYENKDFTNLGFWVGKAMDTIILGQKALKDTKTDIVNFVKGFLSGVGSASVFDDIKACIADVDTFGTDVYTAIEDIKTKDAAKVKQGIILLGQAAQIVPAAAKACQASAADVQKFLNFAKSFANPEAFLYYVGKSLLINHVEVIHEVTSAVQAYESKDWTNLGYWVGKAMDTIIIGQKALKDTQTDVLNFVKGFLAGVSSETIFDNIKTCVTDVDVVVKDVSEGIADIRTKNPAKVKEGIALLGQAAQVIPNAAQVCRASAADIQKFIKFAKTFTNPEAFLYYIGKSLLINHVEVIAEVKSAIAAFDAKNFTDLGYWVGRAMDTIIIGEKQVISQSFVDHLNSLGSTWRAAVPKKFEGMTYEQIKQQYLGAKLIDLNEYKNLTVFNYEGIKDVPAYFNSSEQWPGCVHPIRDQGHCGSCWAFAASEVLSDRFCIASNGAVNVVLSPQYLLSCNNVLNHGCNGGVPLFSWWFIVSDGLVTDSCLPYASANGTQPIKCKDFTQCADGSAIKNYHAVKGSVVQLPNPASIQANIQQYGPVETGFTVYQDFMSYAGGIYTHQSGSALGGHAVKIIGWGTENGTNFWIVANSWGPAWGENGFFRIAFGQCGIDSGVVTGQADVAKLSQSKLPFHRW